MTGGTLENEIERNRLSAYLLCIRCLSGE